MQAVILEANRAAADFYGAEPDALIGRPAASLWAEPTALDDLLELGATIGVHLTEVVHRQLTGETRPVELYLSPMPRHRVHVIVHDTSERTRAEQRARELHAERVARAVTQQAADEWQATFDAISQPIFVLDGQARVQRGNRAAVALTGAAPDVPGGRALGDELRSPFWSALAQVATQRQLGQQLVDEAGRTWSASAVTSNDGQRVILVLQELTDLLALQHEVQRRETMARMGELVAGVAHEVRNPLFAISSLLDAARHRLAAQPDVARMVPLLDAQVQRLSDLMRDLLDYGRPAALERRPTSIADLAHAAELALAPLAASAGVHLQWRLGAAGDQVVEVDRVRFGQLLVNLGANAIQHAPRESEVTLRATALADGIELEVSDAGPGFPPDMLPHVFEPFVTRRPGGTGLGLAIAHRVAHQHGVKIQAGNRVDANGVVQGAVVTLHVPATPLPVPT
ncbi:MAG: PAS domain-containing protein [Gemmatimonadetes bacterium]|nr:PAS domain-containing protein [Gemmatimonadota bacterium]